MKVRERILAIVILPLAALLIALAGCADGTKAGRCVGTTVPVDDAIWCKTEGGELTKGRPGFWRLKRDTNGVWWFLSPEGKQEFLNTVTHVQPFQKGQDANGPHYVSGDYKGPTDVEIWNVDSTGLDEYLDEWAVKTIKRVKEAGFKSLGGWCQPTFHRHDVAVSRCLVVWREVGKSNKLFYEPGWPEAAEKVIKKQVVGLRNNTNLVGYFIDNELGWKEDFGAADRYFNDLAPDNPNRREVMKVIVSLWATIEEFNQDWDTSIKSWDELDGWTELPKFPAATRARLREAWVLHLARDYLSLTTKLIREYDPNHLILGVRFKGSAPKQLFEASRDYTDAMSINVYASDAKLGREMFESMYKLSGQPIVITEYAFHSTDGRSGNLNRSGFIWGHVIDQQAKADGYRLFTARLARVPYIIGADWFQWNDEPPCGRGDGEDVDFGIVDVYDRPYEHMVEAIRQTTPLLNDLHANSFKDTRGDIWQKPARTKPRFWAPYLDEVPTLDADLDDWPQQALIPKMQYLETVGIERADQLKEPGVYLGWTEEGLYLGLEVFDKDVDGYVINEESIKHIWRSGSFDCIEVCFATQPAADDQYWYDQYCHSFLFIPDTDSGEAGTVLQWHRSWDTLDEHLIPHPDIEHALAVLLGRYIVEIFIPAKALNGFDPQAHPNIAGNVFIRNWQPRIDFFWACTESNPPNKWGRVRLIR
ncbi:MAG: hypothetical protein JSV99_10650 [Planctomycetota bacterium]|nr:MAG: hypothetical protein JSV99_10650 [Planctomycetota bacterium]